MKNLSIRWKIIVLVVLGMFAMAIIMGGLRVSDIKKGAVEGMVRKSQAIVLMAEAGRNQMAHKLQEGVIRPLDEIPTDKLLEAVPVVTAMQMAAENAAKAGYRFKAPKISPRNPANKPTAFERTVLEELKSGKIKEKIVVEDDRVRYFKPVQLTQDCLFCHGDPKGGKDPLGGTKEGWKAGEIHGAFEIITSLEQTNKEVFNAAIGVGLWSLLLFVVVIGIIYLFMNQALFTPLARIKEYALAVAGGDLQARPDGAFHAELADVEHSISTMVGNLKGKMLEAEEKSQEAEAQKQRAQEALEEAKVQEAKVVQLLDKMTHVATEAADISEQLASASGELAAQVDEVSSGAEVQDQRSTETATAMEEMNAAVLEVARNSGSAANSADNTREKAAIGADIVQRSVQANDRVMAQARSLKNKMSTLGEEARDIGRILDVISDIADQTNLLALNAAIEAARAGEAGRGFAVVADEVRKLAEKTMQATKEVGGAINEIQTGASENIQVVDGAVAAVQEANTLAKESGDALKRIVQMAVETSDEVRSIATAAEEQSTVSEEINRAVEEISRITAETSSGMQQAAQAVNELAQLAEKLRSLINMMTESK
ncbi:methyl-accepting chemotaxis protein [Desulfoplanes formicivorans]|uniref:methyl-accepting chemotaxis protein n=1 Tax=Desulfoplanes formicivorans TaxID=1592317 RepID=UPI00350E36C9